MGTEEDVSGRRNIKKAWKLERIYYFRVIKVDKNGWCIKVSKKIIRDVAKEAWARSWNHGKEFGFYSKSNGEPLKYFSLGSYIIKFII